MQIGAADRGRCDLQDHIARIDDDKVGVRQRAHLLVSHTKHSLHNSGLSIVRIFKRLQRSGARVLPLRKNEERLREITGCARFWCDPSGNSLKVIARPVKTSDASLDQRGREDPQPIAQGANEGTNWKTNAFVLSGRQGRETADPDYLKRLSTRHRSGTMNDSF